MVDEIQGTRGGTSTARRRALVLVPLAVFLVLAAVFFVRLETGGDSSVVPSALIGSPAPAFALAPLEGLTRDNASVPGLARADLIGKLTLVNIWASWCVPCRAEHPVLTELARDDRLRVVGINYKDNPENARRFLGQLGNPYAAIGTDTTGRSAIDWGVYGVPESFLVGADGTILFKWVGPLSPEIVAGRLMPEIEKALAGV
jgi:cytochrome c biogenesis protein CcmG/thiol:disulfide interchange protein DsbE